MATSNNFSDPLFVGPTRPTMKWGVTYEAMVVGLVLVSIILIGTNNPFSMLLYLPIHATCYLICLKDPRFFGLLSLWLRTKCKSTSWRRYGASTGSHIPATRDNRGKIT